MGNTQTRLFSINNLSLQNIIYGLFFNCNRVRLKTDDKFLVPTNKMNGSNSNISAEAVPLLTTRLARAEQRLKILTCEINAIKEELTAAQQGHSTSTRQFSTSIRRPASEIDGPSTSSDNGVTESKRPRFDSFSKEDDYVVVYTDGACENNGRGNAKAGIGVWFGYNHRLNVSQPITGLATNNRAEIHACVKAIIVAHKNGIKKLKIKTDSNLVIQSLTVWIHSWKKNNWKTAAKTDVKNKEDLVMLDNACKLLDVKWEHVKGHAGVVGNEEADKLAVAGAANYK